MTMGSGAMIVKKLRQKIPPRSIAICCAAAFFFLAAAGILLTFYRASLMEEKKERVKEMVEGVIALVDFYHDKVKNEGMSEEEAKQYAFQAIRDLPYDINGYTWINDMQGVMIMHPTLPELNGKSVLNHADTNGKLLFVEFIKTVKSQGAGFVDYFWPKPNDPKGKEYPKISYVKGFPAWGWIVGSGIYVDDVNDAFWRAVLLSGSLISALLVFAATMFLTLSESFKRS